MESDNIVYTTKKCPMCKVMKSYLSAMGVDFTEIIVDSEDKINKLTELTGSRTVPVLSTKKGVCVGFDKDLIKQIL